MKQNEIIEYYTNEWKLKFKELTELTHLLQSLKADDLKL